MNKLEKLSNPLRLRGSKNIIVKPFACPHQVLLK